MKLRVIFKMSNARGKHEFMYPDNYIYSGLLSESEMFAIAKSPVYYRIAISRSASN